MGVRMLEVTGFSPVLARPPDGTSRRIPPPRPPTPRARSGLKASRVLPALSDPRLHAHATFRYLPRGPMFCHHDASMAITAGSCLPNHGHGASERRGAPLSTAARFTARRLGELLVE